jgi:hypothetical protein
VRKVRTVERRRISRRRLRGHGFTNRTR